MSVLSPKRVFFAILATALLASTAFATHPSPRSYPRAAWDSDAGQVILFGGSGAFDQGTQRTYDADDTWAWTGSRWAERFPAHSAPARTSHNMVHDSTRGRIVMFGGRQMLGTPDGQYRVLNDTWTYDNADWTEIATPNAPPARHHAAMAYDSIRDRVVLFGGSTLKADGFTVESLYDTWEFDGTTWTQASYGTPQILRPLMVFDKLRNQLLLLGNDAELKPKMYRLETASSGARTWTAITPAAMPACINDGSMIYQDHSGTTILTGGLCASSDTLIDKTWEWNGTTWTEIKITIAVGRGTGFALAYDPLRQATVRFGGFDVLATGPRSSTVLYSQNTWTHAFFETRPSPRSLFAVAYDPVKQTSWLLGGMNEFNSSYVTDIWGFRGGQFYEQTVKNAPETCDTPMAAYDPGRSKLVYACWSTGSLDVSIYEYDGVEFKAVSSTRDKPDVRRFGTMVYDDNLKKVVLFGGYDFTTQNFKDDTWTWDGANWAEVKNNKPPNRALHSMWYDPIMKRTVMYGGIGRESIEDRVERFSDMWAFNGSGWTKLNVTTTPGARLGAQYAVDPATGKLLLFGGLKAEYTDPDDQQTGKQFYDNETWQWDGGASSWTKLTPARSPRPRQNGRLILDPVTNRLTLFGGYAGMFFSDIWTWNGASWEPTVDAGGGRRRAAGPTPAQPPAGGN